MITRETTSALVFSRLSRIITLFKRSFAGGEFVSFGTMFSPPLRCLTCRSSLVPSFLSLHYSILSFFCPSLQSPFPLPLLPHISIALSHMTSHIFLPLPSPLHSGHSSPNTESVFINILCWLNTSVSLCKVLVAKSTILHGSEIHCLKRIMKMLSPRLMVMFMLHDMN